ncbi:hypothetical protein HDV05_008039, partial [Chytridiales sp. JEL 0842]
MSAAELSQYKFQLEQVQDALAKDPSNKELLKLESDLKELITLYTSLVPPEPSKPKQEPPSSSSSSNKRPRPEHEQEEQEEGEGEGPTPRWIIGQTVLAKYPKDSKLYEATI